MLRNRKAQAGGIILAGLAAYGIYKYYRMSEQERTDLMSGIKEKGRSLLDGILPSGMKNMFGNEQQAPNMGTMG